MSQPASAADGRDEAGAGHPPATALHAAAAWSLLLAVRRRADAGTNRAGRWGFARRNGVWAQAEVAAAELVVDAHAGSLAGGRAQLGAQARQLLDLHLADALRPTAASYVVGLLGQSLDGFIATETGQSRSINGRHGLEHLHRVRALSDAIVIGVRTAIADRPRLTTRHVPGPHATRVVIDPRGRLPAESELLRDGAAATLVVRATAGAPFETPLADRASALHLTAVNGRLDPRDLVAALAARGMARLLIEGGGVTVARFLEADLLDRLQLVVSPLILGAGHPALPVTPAARLDRARRPSCRTHRLGDDVLFDLEPTRSADGHGDGSVLDSAG